MSDAFYIRLRLEAPPNAKQVKGIRALFPELASQPPATLMKRLRSGAEPVVATVGAQRAQRLRAELLALEIPSEIYGIDDYGPAYLRKLLPAPPAWGAARERGEFVFMPSFSPEVVLRMWKHGTADHAHLAALDTNVFVAHFNVARWLREEGEIPEEAKKADESVVVDSVDAVLGYRLPSMPRGWDSCAIADGILVYVCLETSEGRQEHTYSSPAADHLPRAHAFLKQVLEVSRYLNGLESHRRLAELQRELD